LRFRSDPQAPGRSAQDLDTPETPQAALDRRLRQQVTSVLEFHYGDYFAKERRSHRRFPFHLPVTITPIDDRTARLRDADSFTAFGIDISAHGARFLARQMVPAHKAVLTCEGPGHCSVSLVFELRWARLTNDGWYDTGARFTDVLPQGLTILPASHDDAPPSL
jgi:hypothetical protein